MNKVASGQWWIVAITNLRVIYQDVRYVGRLRRVLRLRVGILDCSNYRPNNQCQAAEMLHSTETGIKLVMATQIASCRILLGQYLPILKGTNKLQLPDCLESVSLLHCVHTRNTAPEANSYSRQKLQFTQPGNHLLAVPCSFTHLTTMRNMQMFFLMSLQGHTLIHSAWMEAHSPSSPLMLSALVESHKGATHIWCLQNSKSFWAPLSAFDWDVQDTVRKPICFLGNSPFANLKGWSLFRRT